MNFDKVLEYRQKYPIFSGSKDALYDAIVDGSYNYDYALLTIGMISRNANELFKNKYIDMLIQIPSPFAWVGINFILLHFTNAKPNRLLTGIYKGKVCEKSTKKPPCEGNWHVAGEFTEDFQNFIDSINLFIKNKSINRDDLNINDYSIFDINNLNPVFYTEQAIKIRKELKESDYKLLKEIADIISIPTDKDKEVKYIDSKHFGEYPLKVKELPKDKIARAIRVQKGDIIGLLVGEQPKFYLYVNDNKDVYIKAGNYCIIRVKDKSINNYLVSYLNDEKARMYFSYTKKSVAIPVLTKGDLGELKVIIPTSDMIKNANEVIEYSINSKKLSPYEINEIIRNSYKIDYKNESQKMIGEDILSAISKMKNKAIRELINDDLNEVEVCFDNKAYKSAIILCGSILEAVLLDWLSEYENTDDILNVAKGEDGRDLELSKIIYKLKELVRPYWYESSKAHEIRKTRNMVHPKECIKNNTKVSVDECRKIINDLNDIIESKESRS